MVLSFKISKYKMLSAMQLIIKVKGKMHNLPPVGSNAAVLVSSKLSPALNPASPPT